MTSVSILKRSSLVTLLTLALSGCQTVPEPTPADYSDLSARAAAGEAVSMTALREAFLHSEDFNTRMQALAPLEQQAMQLMEDEPLRLGAIGTAIIDEYFASITGHKALQRYYSHLGADDAAEEHEAWLSQVIAAVEADADGSVRAPYTVVSAGEAQAYLRLNNRIPVGSMYYSTEAAPFMVLIAAQAPQGRMQSYYFNLTGAYQAIQAAVGRAHDGETFDPGILIDYLAQQEDSAAQASIGSYLYSQQRFDEAEHWFRASSRSGNVLANLMLAHIYQMRALRSSDEEQEQEEALELALDHYTTAIAMGSDDAMFALGTLYLDGYYGEENIDTGVSLLQQAANFGHTDSMLWLGHMHREGMHVEQDVDAARRYFSQAAETGSPRAQRHYTRFLLANADVIAFDTRVVDWLDALIIDDDAEAMLLRGALYARGVGVNQNFRRAQQWYRRAASTSERNAELINEIAWTLAVSHLTRLRQPEYALRIIERTMTSDPVARRNAAYLDTWAAAHAANGNFERALEIQRKAVAAAEAEADENLIEVLQRHLELLEQGQTITDEIP
jgi:uncharacterized protein